MAPQKGTVVTTNQEMDAFRGGSYDQTDFGNRTARPPRTGSTKPHAYLDRIKRETMEANRR